MASLSQPLLKLCICAPKSILDTAEPNHQFVQGIRRAFAGGPDDGSYFASGPDLAVELRVYPATPENPAPVELDSAIHTLVVTLLDGELAKDTVFCTWLAHALDHVQRSAGRHRFLAFAQDERSISQLNDSTLKDAQWFQCHKLGESAIRPAHLALIVLNEARRHVARSLGDGARDFLDLFISHAKRDGLPLASAIQTQLKSVPHATAFYDDKSLLLSEDWKRQLEAGVASSVTAFLRTDGFDESHYCRTEAIWADQYGCPALVVDARRGLSHHPELFDLPLGNLPSVRVPDGNILRILNAAVREGLRAILLTRRVNLLQAEGLLPAGRTWIIHRTPTVRALRHAGEQLAKKVAAAGDGLQPVVVYPGPKNPEHETMEVLLRAILSSCRLVTPESMARIEEVAA